MIPDSILRSHILKALRALREGHEVPARRESKKYDLLLNQHKYPPKYAVSLAYSFVNSSGEMLHGFSGGKEVNNFLIARGFKIVDRGDRISATGKSNFKQRHLRALKLQKIPTQLSSLPNDKQFEFEVRTRAMVKLAKKSEAELVKDYKMWLENQRRELCTARYRGQRCDAYEEKRRNLIEAKCSAKREYIRMAVGQLLDYAYLGRADLGKPNMAILLPKKPDSNLAAWLSELNISLVWREKGAFFDNAKGQFI